MRASLVVAGAVLLAGLAMYRSWATDRELETLRQEVRALEESAELTPLLAGADAIPGDAVEPHAMAPHFDDRREAAATGTHSERSESREAGRRAAREAARARAPSVEPRPGMSEAALAHVQALRRERATQRQVQRLAMLESPEAAVRQDAVFELDADDEQDLAALTSALGDPDPAVRAEAVRQLQFGEPGAVVPLLVQALADLELPVVLEAVDSLKFLGEPGAIPDLEPLLEHPDPRVQTEARAAIERLR